MSTSSRSKTDYFREAALCLKDGMDEGHPIIKKLLGLSGKTLKEAKEFAHILSTKKG